MNPQDIGRFSGMIGTVDVSESQADNLEGHPCLSCAKSVMVPKGRTQAAFASQWGRVGMTSITTSQEIWSRGCRRACVSFWPWHWLAWLPLARKKKKKSSMWTSLFRSSRPTPASTSKITGRGCRIAPAGPAAPATAGRYGLVLAQTPALPLWPLSERGFTC